jgi:PAS domain S-box-containing protein
MAFVQKRARYAEDISTVLKHIDIIIESRDKILDDWLNHDDVVAVLALYSIEVERFKDDYAGEIFDYFVDVINQEKEVGDCPTIGKLLRFFSEKNISSSDLYVLCIHFREASIKQLILSNILDVALYSEITDVYNKNFEGILKLYSENLLNMKHEIEKTKLIFDQYSLALDQSALVSKTDPEGKITYVNSNFIDISGYQEDELIGHTHYIVRHPDMKDDFFKNLWEVISNKRTFRANIKNLNKDGNDYYVDTTILPILDIDNNITEFLSVRYDVTDLVHSRNQALQAEESKDMFLSNMSHEIRTPLNAILGFVDILRKKISDKEHKSYLDTINSSGKALLVIISDILDFAKLRTGKLSINRESFNPFKEFDIVVKLFTKNAEAKSIDYSFDILSKMPESAYGDYIRVNQIVSNFLSNAIKFTPENGAVKVTLEIENQTMKLAVKDSGEGMNDEQQSRIFAAFEQAEKTTTQKHGGTGLGLAISLKLAECMGGDILLKSAIGKGSTFTLSIPLEYDEAELVSIDKLDTSEGQSEEEKEAISLDGHILVAEDNKTNQLLIRLLLEELGLTLDIAENGKLAYEMYIENRITDTKAYDLILMDNQMPELTGIESTGKIRTLEEENLFEAIPIVALTANALKGDRERFLASGMDDYLQKPIDAEALERVLIKYILNKKANLVVD